MYPDGNVNAPAPVYSLSALNKIAKSVLCSPSSHIFLVFLFEVSLSKQHQALREDNGTKTVRAASGLLTSWLGITVIKVACDNMRSSAASYPTGAFVALRVLYINEDLQSVSWLTSSPNV